MAADKAPLITQALIDFLDRVAPDRCPTPEFTDREVWMAAGAAKLVRSLKRVKTEQETQGT